MSFSLVRCRSGILVFAACLSLGTPTARADLAGELENLVDQAMADHPIPGMLVGVWRGDTEVAVFQKGVSSVETMDPINRLDSLKIGSVTKSFTVTRLLQLADEGLVNLDTPIGHYVPTVGGVPLQNGNATLRQLANMTSGIFNYSAAPGFGLQVVENPVTPWTDPQLVAIANGQTPSSAPGAEWHYSNTNTVLLGMVVEQVTGNSIGSEIATHILSPLGLARTVYPATPELPDPHSDGYAILGEDGELTNMSLMTPTITSAAGAMVSTLDDMRLWARDLALGTSLSPEAQAERLQMITTPEGSDPEYDSYGLGIGSLDGWLGHTGDFFGYQSLIMYDPVNDQTVVILQNLSGDGHVPTELFREMSGVLAVPEPGTYILLALGLGALFLLYRAQQARKQTRRS